MQRNGSVNSRASSKPDSAGKHPRFQEELSPPKTIVKTVVQSPDPKI